MSLKVMCAGCSKDEREQAESDVRQAIGARANGTETWIVSVVKVQGRWSVTLDGPAIRALTCTAPPGHLGQAIREAIEARTGGAATAPAAPPPPVHSAPAPARTAAPAPPAAPAATATRSAPAAGPSSATRPAAAASASPAPRPAPAASASPAPRPAPAAGPSPATRPAPAARPPAAGGDGSHACESCAQRFRVLYDATPGEERTMVPVACPHCWHINRLPVGENAAADGDYRAEKA